METASGMINAVGLQNPGIDILEINISYPNMEHGGIAFGQEPRNPCAMPEIISRTCRRSRVSSTGRRNDLCITQEQYGGRLTRHAVR